MLVLKVFATTPAPPGKTKRWRGRHLVSKKSKHFLNFGAKNKRHHPSPPCLSKRWEETHLVSRRSKTGATPAPPCLSKRRRGRHLVSRRSKPCWFSLAAALWSGSHSSGEPRNINVSLNSEGTRWWQCHPCARWSFAAVFTGVMVLYFWKMFFPPKWFSNRRVCGQSSAARVLCCGH